MPLISKVIVSWCKKHPDGDDDGDDGYANAPAACMEGDGDDDDDDGDYDYAPAVQFSKSNWCAFQYTLITLERIGVH